MHLSDLQTPAAVVDLEVVQRNCVRMSDRLAGHGVALRPHVKTHKCVALARLQGGQGICVSTLAEAQAFADAGFDDQILGVPLAPGRIDAVLKLAENTRLAVLVDDARVVEALGCAARARGQVARVWLKMDCGYHRAGVDPESDEALALARSLADDKGLAFQGVLTHAGHSYDCADRAGLVGVARQEVQVATQFAERLRADGIAVPGVSVGSTPTLSVVEDLVGVTEGRPGNYVFHDLHQAGIGSCGLQDIALTVLATVIGVYPSRGTLLLDAGALALSKDPGPTHLGGGGGLGLLADLNGQVIPGLHLAGLSQEHGKVRLDPSAPGPGLVVGDKVRVVPNHSCLVSALHPTLFVAEGHRVVDRWHPVRGW